MMRRLLMGGIKAIVAVAVLATAGHWALRLQREPAASSRVLAIADLPDPVTTGSITPRKASAGLEAVDVTKGLDQRRLSELFAGASPERPKLQKAVARR